MRLESHHLPLAGDIHEVEILGVRCFVYRCSLCGYRDPVSPTGGLITRYDAESSQRDHLRRVNHADAFNNKARTP